MGAFTAPLNFTRPRRRLAVRTKRNTPQHGTESVDLFSRGFDMARRYERGERLTPKRVEQLYRVSPATAKRDLTALRMLLYGMNWKMHPEYVYGCVRKAER